MPGFPLWVRNGHRLYYMGANLAKLDEGEILANRRGTSNDAKADAAGRFAAAVTKAARSRRKQRPGCDPDGRLR